MAATERPSRTILVVEDDHLVAFDIQRHLQRMGHQAAVVHSGETAIASAIDTEPDLVLMDIKLNGPIDGIDAAQKIRSSIDLPIIYLTAYADNQTLDRARATEPYGYVLKPFQERELRAAIDMALQRHDTDSQRTEQQQVQRFLYEASGVLAASLDYKSVVRGAAELLVPYYADWCAIQLRETNDTIPAFGVARPDDGVGNAELVAPLVEHAFVTGRERMMTHLAEGQGMRSLLCVPVLARGRTLGAIALASGRLRDPFRQAELSFAQDFAHRLGMALDNALLYHKAERAVEMRDDVLAIVSHDLRTPLGVIVMQTELLGGDERLQRIGRSIAQAAQRMNRLIGDLLDASAINAGHLTLELGTFQPGEIVHEAAGMFTSQAEARGLSLSVECEADLPRVRCDRDRIIQVLSNLIGNAIKFTSRAGSVRVIARREATRVRLEVSDTGRGIAPDQLPHLFERFWRAQGKRGGAGLGLFIARGIAAAHGSELELESEVGIGSRFWLTLPEQPA